MIQGKGRGNRGGAAVRVIAAIALVALGAGILALVLTGRIPGLGASGTDVATSASASSATAAIAATTTQQKTLATYTWEELSGISAEMGSSGSLEAAREIARRAGLVSSDGALTSDVRDVTLSDGTVIKVQLVGIYHDQRSDGSGIAGLTFATVGAVASRPMNDADTNVGGWEASALRRWLDNDEFALLPSDLSSVVIPVAKSTNNVGTTENVSAVTTTSDRLWLFSAAEVCGTIDWYEHEYGTHFGSVAAELDAVADQEGEQYELFSAAGITARSAGNSSILAKKFAGSPVAWWYRTPFAFAYSGSDEAFFYDALASGYPYGQSRPTDKLGVVFGFCV